MKGKCFCKDCEYCDNGECGIVKDGFDTLEISETGDCVSYEWQIAEERERI